MLSLQGGGTSHALSQSFHTISAWSAPHNTINFKCKYNKMITKVDELINQVGFDAGNMLHVRNANVACLLLGNHYVPF